MKIIFVGNHDVGKKYIGDGLELKPSNDIIDVPDSKGEQLLRDFPRDFILPEEKKLLKILPVDEKPDIAVTEEIEVKTTEKAEKPKSPKKKSRKRKRR